MKEKKNNFQLEDLKNKKYFGNNNYFSSFNLIEFCLKFLFDLVRIDFYYLMMEKKKNIVNASKMLTVSTVRSAIVPR